MKRIDTIPGSTAGLSSKQFDFAQLVGKKITIFSEQFRGKPLESRVLSCTGSEFEVSSGGRFVGNLIGRQSVILQLAYKGEQVAVRAQLKRSQGGRCFFTLEPDVVPLSRRQFRRVDINSPVKMAACPVPSYSRLELARLRWLRTETVNFSSGGVLVRLPSYVAPGVYFLMHIELSEPILPDMVLGQVRHCEQSELSKYNIGVEFIVRETLSDHLSPERRRQLPDVVFTYSKEDRDRLNRELHAWTRRGKAQPR